MLSRFFIPANSYHLQINPTEMTMENCVQFSQILLVLMLSMFFIYYYTLQINDYGESSPLQPDSSGVVVSSYCDTGDFCSEQIREAGTRTEHYRGNRS